MLSSLESDILIYLGSIHTSFLDSFMMLFTGRFAWIPLYLVLFLFLIRRYGWKNAAGFLIVIAAIIAITDQTCATLIRPAVARLRPSNPDNPLSDMLVFVNGYRGGSYGFPSCHAANTFALAVFLTFLTRSRAIAATLFTWAAANCFTRLYLGVHYPTDILVGALIGSAVAVFAYLAMKYYVNFADIRGESHAWYVPAVFILTVIVITALSL